MSRYLSRISRPQLAHTFFPVDGTELAVDVGEHTDGVEGVLGDERVSSCSILDCCDSASECDIGACLGFVTRRETPGVP